MKIIAYSKITIAGRADKFLKKIALFSMGFLLLSILLEVGSAAAHKPQKMPVIVGFKNKSDANLIIKQGGDIKYQYSAISAIACSLPQGAIDALEKNPNIAYVELDGKVQMTQEQPPFICRPWSFDGVDRIDAELAHESSIKGAGIKIAILDTGIDYNHPDLDDNYMGGYDYVATPNDADPMDDNGHGTLCAGIVAAELNEFGVVGVAPEALLYGVKVLDAAGSGDISDVAEGIQWSIGKGMDIISMSLRTTKDYQTLRTMCNAAYEAGILVVAAAGNDYQIRGRNKEPDTVGYPARYDSVIAVGATDITDTRAGYSSTGSTLELAAPGDYIYSTMLGDTYALGSGTSMACPHVSGTAALILSENPDLSATEVRSILRETADDLGSPGWDSWYGYGLIDANAMPGAPSITKLAPVVGAFTNTSTPTISAIVADADGIASRQMTLDEVAVDTTYNSETDLISHAVPSNQPLLDGRHTVALTASDGSNEDVTSWSFTIDTIAPGKVENVMVNPVSSSSLFITWDASSDPDLDHYKVYRKAPDETEYTWMRVYVCPCSENEGPLSFTDTGLESDATYWYKISAGDMAGNEGELSDPASGTTGPRPEEGEMHVDAIFVDWWYGTRPNPKNKAVLAEARVVIVDAGGVPVSGATVYGHWEDAATNSDSGVTGDMGFAFLRSDTVRNPPVGTTFTFVVDTVVLSGWSYNPDLNVETQDSVIYP